MLLAAAFLKTIDPIAFQQWLGFATGWPAGVTWAVALGVVLFEGTLGVFALTAPIASAVHTASTFAAFALFHALMAGNPALGRCPCLGPLTDAMGVTATHAVLGIGSLLIAAFIAVPMLVFRLRVRSFHSTPDRV